MIITIIKTDDNRRGVKMIEELKTFIAVIEFNNFTKAGQKIGLSQPTVSLHIKNLESYFQTVLIQRSLKQKKIYITEQGKILYEKSKEIVRILEETKEQLLGYEDQIKGTLNIGCSFTLGEYFILPFLGEFREKYKDVVLNITIENTKHISEKVERYELDLGLVEGTVDGSRFYSEDFYEDNMILAVSSKNDICRQKFSPIKLESQTWIARENGSGTREYFDRFLLKNNINPKNIIVLGSNYAIKETVKNDIGVTFISDLVVKSELKDGTIKAIDISEDYSRKFSYIYPIGARVSRVSREFVAMLEEYIKRNYEN